MDPSKVFGDKTVVLQLLQRQKEIRQREENVKLYQDTYDPTQPGVLVKYQQIHHRIDVETLKELGYDSCITDWEAFPGIDDLIIPYFEKDEEIMKMLGYPFINGSMNGDVLNSTITDVALISLASKEACVMSGSLVRLFHDYRDRVDFLCVYLAEAHPADTWSWDRKFHYMMDHQTIEDRIEVAKMLISMDNENHQTFTDNPDDDSKVRMVADNITNDFAQTYKAHPDRVIIFEGGKVVFVGEYAEEQMRHSDRLMTDEARQWLQEKFT